jgi:hypothetical protein
MQDFKILSKRIKDLPVSLFFKASSEAMGFDTLQEIVSTTPAALMGNANFNNVWLGELTDILNGSGLLHLIQPTQGNSKV